MLLQLSQGHMVSHKHWNLRSNKRGQAGGGVPALGPSAACALPAERQRWRASRAGFRPTPRAAPHSAAAAPAQVSHP